MRNFTHKVRAAVVAVGILFSVISPTVTHAAFIVPQGGTGIISATAHGLLIGNGVNPFNVTGTGSSGQVLTSNGASADPTFQTVSGTITSATAPISFSAGVISIVKSDSTHDGYLSSTDWNTFNSKGSGSVTSIATNNGLTGGTITTTGTIGLAAIAANSVLGNVTGASGVPTAIATSSLGIALSDTTGNLPIIKGGTATTTMIDKGVNFFNNTLGTVSQAANFAYDYTNNRLGIGSSTPWKQFSIASGNNYLTYDGTTVVVNGSAGATNFQTLANNTSGSSIYGMRSSTSGGVNMAQFQFNRTNTVASGDGVLSLWNNEGAGAILTQAVSIDENGNVGIGTTTPFARLSVQGTLGGTTALFAISSSTATGATSTPLLVDAQGRLQVGYATAAPTKSFEVWGGEQSATSPTLSVIGGLSPTVTLGAQAGSGNVVLDMDNRTSTSPQIHLMVTTGASYLNANGATPIGIATTTPFVALDIATSTAGATTFTGQLALTDNSGGTNLKHWLFSSEKGNLYIGSTTDNYATSTTAALSILNNGNISLSTLGALTIPSLGTPAGTVLAADPTGKLIATTTSNGTVTSVGLSDANSTLTIGGTPVTSSGTLTATLNLAHSNIWTALQQFNGNASSSMESSNSASFGATATSTFDTAGNLQIGARTATTSAQALTLNSTAAASGISLYNTADQSTNYERFAMFVSGNVFNIISQAGGTGSQNRNIAISSGSTVFTVSTGGATLVRSTGTAGFQQLGMTGTLSGSSGTQTTLNLANTYTQTSTAGYTVLNIQPTETTLGSGFNSLIKAGTSTQPILFRVDNLGHVTLATTTAGSYTSCGSLNTDGNGVVGCASAGGGGTVTSVGVATPNSTLTLGGTNPVSTSGTINADLNLAHSNIWTVLQSFAFSSTTLASITNKLYVGGTSTTTIDSTGAINVPSAGSITLTGLATPAGTFVAADATGKLIATSSPAGGTITLSGDVSGSGTTAITTTIGALKVLNSMIQNSTIDVTTKITGLVPIANGGTAASTVAGAQANLLIEHVIPGTISTPSFSNTTATQMVFGGGSIPANALGTKGQIRARLYFQAFGTASSGNFNVNVGYGTATTTWAMPEVNSSAFGSGVMDILLTEGGTTASQSFAMNFFASNAGSVSTLVQYQFVGTGTQTDDDTAAQPFNISISCSAANPACNATLMGATVELLPR